MAIDKQLYRVTTLFGGKRERHPDFWGDVLADSPEDAVRQALVNFGPRKVVRFLIDSCRASAILEVFGGKRPESGRWPEFALVVEASGELTLRRVALETHVELAKCPPETFVQDQKGQPWIRTESGAVLVCSARKGGPKRWRNASLLAAETQFGPFKLRSYPSFQLDLDDLSEKAEEDDQFEAFLNQLAGILNVGRPASCDRDAWINRLLAQAKAEVDGVTDLSGELDKLAAVLGVEQAPEETCREYVGRVRSAAAEGESCLKMMNRALPHLLGCDTAFDALFADEPMQAIEQALMALPSPGSLRAELTRLCDVAEQALRDPKSLCGQAILRGAVDHLRGSGLVDFDPRELCLDLDAGPREAPVADRLWELASSEVRQRWSEEAHQLLDGLDCGDVPQHIRDTIALLRTAPGPVRIVG